MLLQFFMDLRCCQVLCVSYHASGQKLILRSSEDSLNLLNSIVCCLWFRLSNLFHGMDKNTPVRYTVYCSLLKVASSCGAIQYIPTELDQVINYGGASSYSHCINSVASH